MIQKRRFAAFGEGEALAGRFRVTDGRAVPKENPFNQHKKENHPPASVSGRKSCYFFCATVCGSVRSTYFGRATWTCSSVIFGSFARIIAAKMSG